VIVKLPLAILPAPSVAEQPTVVTPSGNVEPETAEHVTATDPLTRSLAETVKFTTAPDGPVASSVMLAGKVSVGGVVSWMVTLKLPLVVLPALSVAEQSTLVVPSGNVLPEAGVQDTVTEPSTMSVAEAEKETTAPDGPVASAVISPGRVRIGAVVS